MKNIIKKNQIVIFVIGIMIIAAGYFNYTNNNDMSNSLEAGAIADSEEMASIGDARLVSANVSEKNGISSNPNEIEGNKADNKNENDIKNTNEISVNTIENSDTMNNNVQDELDKNTNSVTPSVVTNTEEMEGTDAYFTNSRLERETMYSQRIENYQDLLNNTNVSEAQKKLAQEEIMKLNNEQNAIMIAENLIKTKGIEDLIIFINGESINVIVKGDDLEKEEIAQIQNILTRELEADISNIHIMNK